MNSILSLSCSALPRQLQTRIRLRTFLESSTCSSTLEADGMASSLRRGMLLSLWQSYSQEMRQKTRLRPKIIFRFVTPAVERDVCLWRLQRSVKMIWISTISGRYFLSGRILMKSLQRCVTSKSAFWDALDMQLQGIPFRNLYVAPQQNQTIRSLKTSGLRHYILPMCGPYAG